MVEKKNLRKMLREMAVGETISVHRDDYLPSSVKASAYMVGADFGMKFRVLGTPEGVEVSRES